MLRNLALAACLLVPLSTAWAASLPQGAGNDRPATVWLCSLSSDATQLVCIADADGGDDAVVPARATAVVHGTRFPLDPRQRWTVDFWSPFTGEPAWLELLARATICYRSPGCEVIVHDASAFRPPPAAGRGGRALR